MSYAPHVLFYGDGNWTRYLADGLATRFPSRARTSALGAYDPDATPARLIRALLSATVVCRVGYVPSLRSRKDRAWDAICHRFPRRRSFIYWIGTDVQRLLNGIAEDTVTAADRSAIARATSIAGSTVLRDELATVGITAATVPFPLRPLAIPDPLPPLPATTRVLTYIPDRRFAFYGGPQILEAARALPDIGFLIMGGSGPHDVTPPGNVRFLGHVDDVPSLLGSVSVLVRTTEHDSIGATVAEAMLFGRHVITTNQVPHTRRVAFGDAAALIRELQDLDARSRAGTLALDLEAHRYALAEFDSERRFTQLLETLLA